MTMVRRSIIAVVVVLSGGCSRTLPTHGAPSERALIRGYVAALEGRDVDAMKRLLHPRGDPGAALAEITTVGGRQFEHIAVDLKYSESLAPHLATADVSLTYRDPEGTNVTLTRTLPLLQDGDRWFVGLGLPPALPSSP
jgi:hypothetical protein